MKKPLNFLQKFINQESIGGIILLLAALLAIGIANSAWANFYHLVLSKFLFVINDGLMAIFFFLIGLELRRELKGGELSKGNQIILPLVAALGGIIIPAFIYNFGNYLSPETQIGWAIPVATDIAFALGVLSLFGKRVPIGLKLFVMALAIFDDLGAIIIIAFFYAHHFAVLYFLGAIFVMVVGYLLNLLKIRRFYYPMV